MTRALRVTVLFRSKPLRSRTFLGERFVIGRDPECDLSLFNVGVSRQHAVVERVDQGYVLRDLGSSNGTFVEDRAIQAWPIEEGGKARISHYELVFRFVDSGTARDSATPGSVPGFGEDKTMCIADD